MMMPYSNEMIVFDLDDTLYKEIDFVRSGFKAVADFVDRPEIDEEIFSIWNDGGNAFQFLIDKFRISCTIPELLNVYRNHHPDISLDVNTIKVLDILQSRGIRMGIITDGRSKTQRNKINALKLGKWINDDDVVISEEIGCMKPSMRNYEYFITKYSDYSFSYVGDNLQKDFICPNQLGWKSICLKDDGRNIHEQDFNKVKTDLPHVVVNSLLEIL